MIQINQMKLPIEHNEEQLENKIRKTLRLGKENVFSYEIMRQSLDARKKNEKKFVYQIHVKVDNEGAILRRVHDKNVMSIKAIKYKFPIAGTKNLKHPPVIVGAGPAGLFCGYMLAAHGYAPILLERGEDVDNRVKRVQEFWEKGVLNTESNPQFGEGGAGTFSDGKLNTLVKDPIGRNRQVLQVFVDCGAPKEILYEQKPHLGTDALTEIVKNMRQKIQEMGGQFRFNCKFTDFSINDHGQLQNLILSKNETLPAEVMVLATGHSARDTFQMLYDNGIEMHQKSFAVGVRIEHPQKMVNQALYGEEENPHLGAAAYKLTAKTSNGRGAYTFCMCPGGYVVNASSEENRLAVNGMSYEKRDGENANSALIVTVSPEDFPSNHPLSGVEYQRRLEKAAYETASGKIPLQLYGDFKTNQVSNHLGEVNPSIKGAWAFANLKDVLPEYVSESIEEAIEQFDSKIKGFAREDAILSGVESRTSSPVRIERNEKMECNIAGIYPCGEGAGYAGGITSAAMDGIKVAEAIAATYAPKL